MKSITGWGKGAPTLYALKKKTKLELKICPFGGKVAKRPPSASIFSINPDFSLPANCERAFEAELIMESLISHPLMDDLWANARRINAEPLGERCKLGVVGWNLLGWACSWDMLRVSF